MLYTCLYQFKLGKLYLLANDEALLAVNFHQQNVKAKQEINPILAQTIAQLDEYFLGKRKYFSLPLKLSGTAFQLAVWKQLQSIPYGKTCSYKDIATAINHPRAYRAVGMANNRNNIAIIIPCHRVIGNNQKLVGYAGGLAIKAYLLDLEQNYNYKEGISHEKYV